MNKPNFFIIGAPKCGTTSLASWLENHPQVCMGYVKEPNYFNTDIHTPNRMSEDEYLKLFNKCDGTKVKCIGEASTRYLYSKVASKNILSFDKNAKLIVMLRNPVDMIYSLHNHLVYLGVEQFEDFGDAWGYKDLREKGWGIIDGCSDPDSLAYGQIGKFGEQLERLFEVVPDSQVLVIIFDDLIAHPENVYNQVTEFLRIEKKLNHDYPVLNKSMAKKLPFISHMVNWLGSTKEKWGIKKGWGVLAKVNQWNRCEKIREDMGKRLHEDIIKYFQSDIAKLEVLLKRDLSHWRGARD